MAGGGNAALLRRATLASTALALASAFVLAPGAPAICPMRVLLHVPCPTCGLTRAARLLLQGDVAAAIQMHPLSWLVVPVVGAFLGVEVWTYLRTGALGRSLDPKGVRIGVLGLFGGLLLVWLVRAMGAMGGPVPIA